MKLFWTIHNRTHIGELSNITSTVFPPNSIVMPRVIWAQNTIEDSFTFSYDFWGERTHQQQPSSNVEYE